MSLILILSALILPFQNCGKLAQPAIDEDAQKPSQTNETVIGATSAFNKISHDSQLEVVGSPSLEIDVQSGTLVSNGKTCALDATRLSEARALLATSNICKPGPLPPGTVSCQAIAMADIRLSNASDSVELRRLYCNYGVFLCDGNDQKLRDLISDLKTNPPTGCLP